MLYEHNGWTDENLNYDPNTTMYDGDICIFGSYPNDILPAGFDLSTAPMLRSPSTKDANEFASSERLSPYTMSACPSPCGSFESASNSTLCGSTHIKEEIDDIGCQYYGHPLTDSYGYDAQTGLRPYYPEPHCASTGPWIASICCFGTTCGVTIPNASITDVFDHLMQYHADDPHCPFFSVKDEPVRCAWERCGESRESARSLCEHIVAQHINVCEPEGYMNSELMYGPYWPSTMEEPTCTMLSGSPLLQKPLDTPAHTYAQTVA